MSCGSFSVTSGQLRSGCQLSQPMLGSESRPAQLRHRLEDGLGVQAARQSLGQFALEQRRQPVGLSQPLDHGRCGMKRDCRRHRRQHPNSGEADDQSVGRAAIAVIARLVIEVAHVAEAEAIADLRSDEGAGAGAFAFPDAARRFEGGVDDPANLAVIALPQSRIDRDRLLARQLDEAFGKMLVARVERGFQLSVDVRGGERRFEIARGDGGGIRLAEQPFHQRPVGGHQRPCRGELRRDQADTQDMNHGNLATGD